MSFRLEFEGFVPTSTSERQLAVHVYKGDRRRVLVGPWSGEGLADAPMIRFLRQVHDEVQAGLVQVGGIIEHHHLQLEIDDYSSSRADAERACSWQKERGRDLYCVAAHYSETNASVIRELPDGQFALETDLATCSSCMVPDDRVLCDGFSHPKMSPHMAMGGGKLGQPSRIHRATCRLGSEEIRSPSECRPGGNSCWYQSIDPDTSSTPSVDGFHLLEAFDFIDSEWRHRNPGHRLVLPTSIAEAALITQDVHTRADFRDQVVRVGELLQSFKINGNLFEAKAKAGPLERLGQWCEEHAPNGLNAVSRLMAVNHIRNAFSHTDPPRTKAALAVVGIEFPPPSWTTAWRDLMSFLDAALRDLRREIVATDSQYLGD